MKRPSNPNPTEHHPSIHPSIHIYPRTPSLPPQPPKEISIASSYLTLPQNPHTPNNRKKSAPPPSSLSSRKISKSTHKKINRNFKLARREERKMGAALSQSFFLPSPPLTASTCPDQTGRVWIVTGGYSGIGLELCRIVYARNATVYIAGRSRTAAATAIREIERSAADSQGKLWFLEMDYMDMGSVRGGVDEFLGREERLDVLVNNAGIMLKSHPTLPIHNTHLLTNILAPTLLTKLLTPLLTSTAASSPTASVRVLWAGSIAVHVSAPRPGGMKIDGSGRPTHDEENGEDGLLSYGASKVGNVFLSRKFAERGKKKDGGVVHVCFNPGNLSSGLQRYWGGGICGSWYVLSFDYLSLSLSSLLEEINDALGGWSGRFKRSEKSRCRKFFFFPARYGAYTELFAALSPEITPAKSGAYIYPWGRFGDLPADVEDAIKSEEEGGTGVADRFVEWCEREVDKYL
ncbi:unnamed protein product [Periconia digitata]|uniref:NAD(P)-binding protein n=1 Tax=Periconia digitata TaxID=1303443 RepID=A0A9W4UE93_9PLEO|nr:unnamed protein product [Periconia digitata]